MQPFLDTRGLVNKAKLLFLTILRTLSEAFLQPPLRATTPKPHYHPEELVYKTILIRVFIFDQLLHPHSKRLTPNLLIILQLCGINQSKSNHPTSTILNRSTRRDCLQPDLLFTIIQDILIATYLYCTRIFKAIGHLVLPVCSRHLISKTEVDWGE